VTPWQFLAGVKAALLRSCLGAQAPGVRGPRRQHQPALLRARLQPAGRQQVRARRDLRAVNPLAQSTRPPDSRLQRMHLAQRQGFGWKETAHAAAECGAPGRARGHSAAPLRALQSCSRTRPLLSLTFCTHGSARSAACACPPARSTFAAPPAAAVGPSTTCDVAIRPVLTCRHTNKQQTADGGLGPGVAVAAPCGVGPQPCSAFGTADGGAGRHASSPHSKRHRPFDPRRGAGQAATQTCGTQEQGKQTCGRGRPRTYAIVSRPPSRLTSCARCLRASLSSPRMST
jgi:hypothetical protein